MDWENQLEKKSDPKNWKNSKNQIEIAACEQKTTTEKPNFCSNKVFSLYFKIRAKKIHAAKPLAFSLHFPFRRDQNHYNLTSKIMKRCEQILKKHSRTSLEIQFKELNENLRSTLPDQQINRTMPALNKHKQNYLKKMRNKQSNKLNKNILIAKTEAFQSKAKFFSL